MSRGAVRAFEVLPFLNGLGSGLLAAFLAYTDDLTWGAQRGNDTVKFILFTFAATTGGFALTEPPARALRKRLKRRRKPSRRRKS